MRNFDGVQIVRTKPVVKKSAARTTGPIDAIAKRKITFSSARTRVVVTPVPKFLPVVTRVAVTPKGATPRTYLQYLLPVVLVLLFGAFAAGVSFGVATPHSSADKTDEIQSIATSTIPLGATVITEGTSSPLSQTIFNTPLDLLSSFFESSQKPDILVQRKIQLQQYLESKHSPLAPYSDLIAEQPHWKLILAISFAESTLGKHCYEFNCSGIGGSQIKTYPDFPSWIVDFNRLLEKRYRDKTLEQMCGVYVKPCTDNWLLATQTILSELDALNIQ